MLLEYFSHAIIGAMQFSKSSSSFNLMLVHKFKDEGSTRDRSRALCSVVFSFWSYFTISIAAESMPNLQICIIRPLRLLTNNVIDHVTFVVVVLSLFTICTAAAQLRDLVLLDIFLAFCLPLPRWPCSRLLTDLWDLLLSLTHCDRGC